MSSIYNISLALKDHLSLGGDDVQLQDPAEVTTKSISLWLYHVQPDEFVRNAPPPILSEAVQAGVHTINKRKRSAVAPLGVNLHYLVTPLLGTAHADQEAIGQLLLTIHESPLLRVPEAGSREEEQVRIILPADSLEDRIRLWEALQGKPYRLSFTCVVRTARLYSSRVVEEAPVLTLTSASLPEFIGS